MYEVIAELLWIINLDLTYTMTYNVCSRENKDKKNIQTEGRQWADRITWRRERLRGIRLYVFTQKRKNQKRRRIAEKIQVTISGDSERVRSWATG